MLRDTPTEDHFGSAISVPKRAESFVTTRWTQVRRAKEDSQEGRRALSDLCRVYYEPVVTFLRYELRDKTGDAAREFAHDFFAQILSGSSIFCAVQERGRFRSYLLGAVKHYLFHRREAAGRLKRGGGAKMVPLDDEESPLAEIIPDDSTPSPEENFDRQWALTVVAHAFDALRQECTNEGRADFFERVKPWLAGDTARGNQVALAEACNLNPTALKVAIHRLKKRYRELVREEVAGTLDDPSLVDNEMQSLFAALSKP